MNNNYFLDRIKLDQYVSSCLSKLSSGDTEFDAIIEESSFYMCNVYSNAYFIAKNIDQRVKRGSDSSTYLADIDRILEEKSFMIEEFNVSFIDFMIKHKSNKTILLDEQILEIHDDYINKNYGKQVCY